MLLFLWLACTQDKIHLDDSGTVDSSTDTTDTDTVDTGDTGDTGTTATTPDGTPVTFDLSGEWGGTTLALTGINFDADNNLVLGESLATAPADAATVTVYLPDPSELTPNPDAPGTSFAIYVASLHHDEDGDGYPSGFETIAGVGAYWLLFWQGPVPPDLANMGLVEGWNAYDALDTLLGDLGGVPLDTNMVPNDHVAMAGSVDGSVDGLRMMLWPQAQAVHRVSSLLYEGALTDPWSITLDAAPDSDHLFDADGTELALEFPLVYQDVDASGGPSDGDTAVLDACLDNGDQVALLYIPEVTSLATALTLANQRVGAGWMGASFDAAGQLAFVSEADLLTLSLCTYTN